MTHPKKSSIADELLKYWPIITVIFISLAGYVTLGNTVSANNKDIEKLKETSDISKVTEAKMSAQLDYIYQAIKEAKTR